MKRLFLLGVLVCNSTLLVAQPPPPAASVIGPVNTVSGTISQFNYGADGRVEGFIVGSNTLVNLPPDLAIQVEMVAKAGNQVRVTGSIMPTGSGTPTGSGMQIVQPQSVDVAGKTLTMAVPSQPVPYAGSGVIRSLNYGRQGEVNGFVLQNGVIARTPAIGASDVSVVKPGASISVSGFARTTATGRTVVDVQSITANGQTIAMNVPPAAPGPGRGPRGGPKGPRDLEPLPPAAGAPVPPPPPPPVQ